MEKGASKEGRQGWQKDLRIFSLWLLAVPSSLAACVLSVSIYQAGEQNGNVIEIH